jgi:hypothetical protein
LGKGLIIVTLVFCLLLNCISLSHNLVTIITPDASASSNATIQELNTSDSQNVSSLALAQAQENQSLSNIEENQAIFETAEEGVGSDTNATTVNNATLEIGGFYDAISISVAAIAGVVVVPLVLSIFLRHRQEMERSSRGVNVNPMSINQLFRVLVAIGVIFVVILIVVYLNSLI